MTTITNKMGLSKDRTLYVTAVDEVTTCNGSTLEVVLAVMNVIEKNNYKGAHLQIDVENSTDDDIRMVWYGPNVRDISELGA